MTVIDAENAVVGRLSTDVAKRLLKREKIDIINADKAVFTGNKAEVFARYLEKTKFNVKGNPRKGPKFPKMPDRILKRAVRGMLPWKITKGKEAYKNLKAHIGVPEEFSGVKAEKPEKAILRGGKHVSVGEISKMLGAKW